MKRYLLLLLMVFLLFGLLSVFSTSSYAADSQFEYVLPCVWRYIESFSEGLAMIQGYNKDGGAGYFGFVDGTGKIQIPLEWDEAKPFSEGIAPVKRDGVWGYINKEGLVVIEPQFYEAALFYEGLACVAVLNEFNKLNYGYIDKTGAIVINPDYYSIMRFREGLAAVCKDDKWGYISSDGQTVIGFNYDRAYSFYNGYAVVVHSGDGILIPDTYLVIDRVGNVVLDYITQPFIYDPESGMIWILANGNTERYSYSIYSNDYFDDYFTKPFKATADIPTFRYSPSYTSRYLEEFGVFIILDGNSNQLFFYNNEFKLIAALDDIRWIDKFGQISDGIIAVHIDGKVGYVNVRGEIVVEPCFLVAKNFSEGRAIVRDKNFQYGMIRLTENAILRQIYTKAADAPLLEGDVFVNNEKVDFDTPPLLINNRTMIPIRAVFERLGCTVEWLDYSNTTVIVLEETRVEIVQDANGIIKNGEYIDSDLPAFNYQNRIYAPLRIISEALGCNVTYNEATGNVFVEN